MVQSFWYKHLLRVRYQETDQMGVVYHANYANWFEIGRTEMIRQMGIPYRELELRGLLLPVTELEIKFRMPARYDDVVGVYTRIVEASHVRLQIESQVREAKKSGSFDLFPTFEPVEAPEGELLVHGGTRHVWLDRSWRPTRIDKTAPDLFELLIRHMKQQV